MRPAATATIGDLAVGASVAWGSFSVAAPTAVAVELMTSLAIGGGIAYGVTWVGFVFLAVLVCASVIAGAVALTTGWATAATAAFLIGERGSECLQHVVFGAVGVANGVVGVVVFAAFSGWAPLASGLAVDVAYGTLVALASACTVVGWRCARRRRVSREAIGSSSTESRSSA